MPQGRIGAPGWPRGWKCRPVMSHQRLPESWSIIPHPRESPAVVVVVESANGEVILSSVPSWGASGVGGSAVASVL